MNPGFYRWRLCRALMHLPAMSWWEFSKLWLTALGISAVATGLIFLVSFKLL